MLYYAFKLITTAALIVSISEISKRSTFIGGLLASLPIISLLSIMWIYVDTKDTDKIANFSSSVFWLVIPTLPFFLLFPYMLRKEINFYLSLTASTALMMGLYLVMVAVLRKYGIEL